MHKNFTSFSHFPSGRVSLVLLLLSEWVINHLMLIPNAKSENGYLFIFSGAMIFSRKNT
jgi:hypothetical protein